MENFSWIAKYSVCEKQAQVWIAVLILEGCGEAAEDPPKYQMLSSFLDGLIKLKLRTLGKGCLPSGLLLKHEKQREDELLQICTRTLYSSLDTVIFRCWWKMHICFKMNEICHF